MLTALEKVPWTSSKVRPLKGPWASAASMTKLDGPPRSWRMCERSETSIAELRRMSMAPMAAAALFGWSLGNSLVRITV
ncbi:hypothetical protein ACVWW4_001674 [Bradyrhizobium sp. LB7.1]